MVTLTMLRVGHRTFSRQLLEYPFLRFFTLVLMTILLYACGAGAVSQSSNVVSSNSFKTAEYYQSSALDLVDAAQAYTRGGTGLGITIAVMDSGVNANHVQLQGQVSSSGYDYVLDQAGVSEDSTGHGTHVAGLIAAKKDGQEMHGLAYAATILPLRVLNGGGTTESTTDAEMAAATLRAVSQGSHIFNNSWGDSSTNILSHIITTDNVNSWHAEFLVQARSAIAQDSVYVWAAGNQSANQSSYHAGLPHLLTDLQTGWLAVTAVDETGTLASYSNQCGVSAAWCLAAPGGGNGSISDGLYSTQADGNYEYRSGTSMAAPQVSAALAVLKTQFPNLSYQQLAARLLTTANKTGVYANDAIYGQGLLDLNAASSVVGSLSIPVAARVGAGPSPVLMSAVQVGPSLAIALGAQLEGQSLLLLDSYQQAPFWIDASRLVINAPTQVTLWQDLSHKENPTKPITLLAINGIAKVEMAGLSHRQGFDEPIQQQVLNLNFGGSKAGWQAHVAHRISGLEQSPESTHFAVPFFSNWRKQWQASYAWPELTAFLRHVERDSIHREIIGEGVFKQNPADQQQWGISWHKNWGITKGSISGQAELGTDDSSQVNAVWSQSALTAQNHANQLWHWGDTILLNQLSTGWQTRRDKVTYGVNVSAAQVSNSAQASLRWPNKIDMDGNINYQKINIAASQLFNYQKMSAFVNWQINTNTKVKLEAKQIKHINWSPLVSSRLVWQGSW